MIPVDFDVGVCGCDDDDDDNDKVSKENREKYFFLRKLLARTFLCLARDEKESQRDVGKRERQLLLSRRRLKKAIQ